MMRERSRAARRGQEGREDVPGGEEYEEGGEKEEGGDGGRPEKMAEGGGAFVEEECRKGGEGEEEGGVESKKYKIENIKVHDVLPGSAKL